MNFGTITVAPFSPEYRASGILLHVTSLPSRYGVGDMGPAATSWIDRLAESGQSWWQMLPLGPTGYGNSPYSSLSSFAANELLISPDWLVEDQFLRTVDIQNQAFPENKVDYDSVIPFKHELLVKAWANFRNGARADLRSDIEQFRREQGQWLEDYALFRALKEKFAGANYLEWPVELVGRQTAAVDRARGELADQIDFLCFAQYLSFRQSRRLRAYANSKGVRLMGDLPFFVSPDSSDVWAHPELFLLDEHRQPRVVAGVPPDYFSEHGQLWGNPIYDWDALRQSDYSWSISRFRALLAHVDVIRLDHFRAFVAAWHVQAGAPTAQLGKWIAGPDGSFFDAAQRNLGSLPFIAEDLGAITQDVYAVRDQFQLPGMRVLQFAFDGDSKNPHLPQNYDTNTVVYTGTHDNPTTRAWFDKLPDSERKKIANHLSLPNEASNEVAPALISMAWSSVAALSIVPLQDLLNLGEEGRMNVPGHPDGNWSWRCTESMLADPAFEWLRELTIKSNRTKAIAGSNSGKILETVSRN